MKKPWMIVVVIAVLVAGYVLGRQVFIRSTGVGESAPQKDTAQQGNNNPVQVKDGAVLDLSGNNLKSIPSDTFSRVNLVELNVSNNSITGAIQAEIRQLKNLKVLRASNNQMTGVPAEIGQLENLEILDLSNNQITGLPLELGNLKRIKTINLSGNNYSTYDLNLIRNKLPQVHFILNEK